jgi:hypothetical protein
LVGVCPLAFSIHFLVDPAWLPRAARLEIDRTMQQVADAVSTIAPENAFWGSIRSSVLQIDVAGYRVVYRVLPRSGEVHVVEVQPLPGTPGGRSGAP